METRWGKRLGRYEIVSELGRGAMGAVYKARDPKIDRFVAIKTITLRGVEDGNQFRERFFVEAQAAGRLLHPGIVTIFDVAEEPDTHDPYIVMEYIPGSSLEQLLSGENKKLPLDRALKITEELAEALDCAHAQGIVHRDIKPANILMTEDGHPKIADFGIARLDLPHLTIPGRVLGTPAYMSPEQLEGETVDGRSDLFSLGVILYRMITGYGPFQGNSITTVCFKVANRNPVAASALNAELPPQLDFVIGRAMAKDPKERYQRGMEFALDLRELRERSTPENKSTSRTAATHSQGNAGSGNRRSCSKIGSGFGVGWKGYLWEAFRQHVDETVLPWSKRPSVRAAFLISIAAIALALPSYYENWPPSRPKMEVMSAALTQSTKVMPAASAQKVQPVPPPSETHAPPQTPAPHSIAKPLADSTLEVRVNHPFAVADISLWIDDKLTYSGPLSEPSRKRLVFFRTSTPETQTLRLAHGKHRIQVRVHSAPDQYDQTASVSGNFAKAALGILRVSCEKRNGEMHLVLQ